MARKQPEQETLAVETALPPVVELAEVTSDAGDAPSPGLEKRMTRGLEAATLLEASAVRVQRCGTHVQGASRSRTRKRTARQLERLARLLASVQEAVLTHGVSRSAFDELEAQLGPLDAALEEFLAGKARKRRMKPLRRSVRATRRALRG